MAASSTFTQEAFRDRNDDGNETGATWANDLNTNWDQVIGHPFRVRFLVSRAAKVADTTNCYFTLLYSLNGAAYIQIGELGDSDPVNAAGSSYYTQGDNTTQQLGSGTFEADNAHMVSTLRRGTDFTWDLNAGETESEIEYSIVLRPGSIVPGDVVELRAYFQAGSAFLGGYVETPSITAISPAQLQLKGGTASIKGGTITLK